MMDYHTVCRIIERIGDHVSMISKNMKTLVENNAEKDLMDMIVTLGDSAKEVFVGSVKAWSDKNIEVANNNISDCKKLVGGCNNVNRLAMKEKFNQVMAASLIAGSLRRIAEYSMDISENAINLAV